MISMQIKKKLIMMDLGASRRLSFSYCKDLMDYTAPISLSVEEKKECWKHVLWLLNLECDTLRNLPCAKKV